jgi:hypothetical protein
MIDDARAEAAAARHDGLDPKFLHRGTARTAFAIVRDEAKPRGFFVTDNEDGTFGLERQRRRFFTGTPDECIEWLKENYTLTGHQI